MPRPGRCEPTSVMIGREGEGRGPAQPFGPDAKPPDAACRPLSTGLAGPDLVSPRAARRSSQTPHASAGLVAGGGVMKSRHVRRLPLDPGRVVCPDCYYPSAVVHWWTLASLVHFNGTVKRSCELRRLRRTAGHAGCAKRRYRPINFSFHPCDVTPPRMTRSGEERGQGRT
jgi:hypothetical protein